MKRIGISRPGSLILGSNSILEDSDSSPELMDLNLGSFIKRHNNSSDSILQHTIAETQMKQQAEEDIGSRDGEDITEDDGSVSTLSKVQTSLSLFEKYSETLINVQQNSLHSLLTASRDTLSLLG